MIDPITGKNIPDPNPILANGGNTDVKPESQQTANPLVQRYSTPTTPVQNPLDKARSDLLASMPNTTPDREAIREQARKDMQAQIDATDRYYLELKNREQQAGQVRMDKTRGINVRAGLSGSDFASANTESVARENDKAMAAIEAERLAKVSEIMNNIEDRASKEFEFQRTLAASNAEKRVSLLADIEKQAKTDIETMAKSGYSLDRFKESTAYAQLQKESGLSGFELDAIYNANMPKKAQKDIHYEKLGNNKIVAFWTADDGTLKREEYDFEVPAEKKLRVIDGVPYYEDSTTQSLVPAKGFTPKPKTDNSNLTTTQRSALNRIIDGFRKSPLIAASDRTVVLENSIKGIQTDPGNATLQLNLGYSYVQALDTYQSAVREGELKNLNEVDSKIGEFKNYAEKMINGQIVRPEVAKKIAASAKILVDAIKDGAKRAEKDFASQAKVNGIEKSWQDYRGGFEASFDEPQEPTDPLVQKATSAGIDPSEVETLRSQGYSDEQINALLDQ